MRVNRFSSIFVLIVMACAALCVEAANPATELRAAGEARGLVGGPGDAQGDVLETFPNTWATDTIGVAIDRKTPGRMFYFHESDPSPGIWIVDTAPPHNATPFSYSKLGGTNTNGGAVRLTDGYLYASDYQGGLGEIDDNIYLFDRSGNTVAYWLTDGPVGTIVCTGGPVDRIIDLAVHPANPDIVYATAGFDGNSVYMLDLSNTSGGAASPSPCVVLSTIAANPGSMTDLVALEYDTELDGYWAADWGSDQLLLLANDGTFSTVLESFNGHGGAGFNTGVSPQWPSGSPRPVWVTDYGSGATTLIDSGTSPSVSGLARNTHFDSIDSNECCGGSTVVPPDPDIAVGPDHVVVAVNLALEIYDKYGTSLMGPTLLSDFFSGLSPSCSGMGAAFYPSVLYDEVEDRFVVGADGNGEKFCVAATKTADPTGDWWLYEFQTDVGGAFFDWPQVGIGDDGIFVGASMFGTGTGRVWAFEKSAIYAGGTPDVVTEDLGSYGRPQPLNLHAVDGAFPSPPHYFLSLTDPPSAGVFRIHFWDDPFGFGSFGTAGFMNLQAVHGVPVGEPVSFPQAGGTLINGAPNLFRDFEYSDGSAWVTNHVACDLVSGTVNCIQWGELDIATLSVTEAGVYGSEGVYRSYPDLAIDGCGNMIVAYTQASTGVFPSIAAAGREPTDPPGQLKGEVVAKHGEIPYSAFNYRWGEYMGMAPDPDGLTVWYVGEYSKDNGNGSANWGNYVQSFSFTSCTGIFDDGFETGDTSRWSTTNP